MVSDTLEQRIYELVRSHDGIYLFKKKELTPSTDLDSDLQLEDGHSARVSKRRIERNCSVLS